MSGTEKLRAGQCDDLNGKRAVVTGAGSGLGRSIARAAKCAHNGNGV